MGERTLGHLVSLRSELSENLLNYYSAVIAAPDHYRPNYMYGRLPSRLYIESMVTEDIDVSYSTSNQVMLQDTEAEEFDHTDPQSFNAILSECLAPKLRWCDEIRRLASEGGARISLFGPPGQGKSFCVAMSAKQIAISNEGLVRRRQIAFDQAAIPVVIPLRRLSNALYRESDLSPSSIGNAISHILCESIPDTSTSWIVDVVNSKQVTLFLDGLDEVRAGDEAIEGFFNQIRIWKSNIVITARPYGFNNWSLPFRTNRLKLAPLQFDQIKTYAQHWFDDQDQSMQILGIIQKQPVLRQLCQVPYLLELVCAVADANQLSPEMTHSELYTRALQLMLGRDRSDAWMPLLTALAWKMVQRNPESPSISGSDLLDCIRESPVRPSAVVNIPNASDQENAEALQHELSRKRFIAQTGSEMDYGFVHRSFGAYLSGRHIATLVNQQGWSRATIEYALITGQVARENVERFVDRKAWDPEWGQTVQFLAGQLSQPRPLLDLLSQRKTDDYLRHRLSLAAHCLPHIDLSKRSLLAAQCDHITTDVMSSWFGITEVGMNDAAIALSDAFVSLATINANVCWKGKDTPPVPAVSEDGPLMSGFMESMFKRTCNSRTSETDLSTEKHKTSFLDAMEKLLDDESIFMWHITPITCRVLNVAPTDRLVSTALSRLEDTTLFRMGIDKHLRLLHALPPETASTEMSGLIRQMFTRYDQDAHGWDRPMSLELLIAAAIRYHVTPTDDVVSRWYGHLNRKRPALLRLICRLPIDLSNNQKYETYTEYEQIFMFHEKRSWADLISKAKKELRYVESSEDRVSEYYMEPTPTNLSKISWQITHRSYLPAIRSILAIGEDAATPEIWDGMGVILPTLNEYVRDDYLEAVRVLGRKGVPDSFRQAVKRAFDSDYWSSDHREWPSRVVGAMAPTGIDNELVSHVMEEILNPVGGFRSRPAMQALEEMVTKGIRVFKRPWRPSPNVRRWMIGGAIVYIGISIKEISRSYLGCLAYPALIIAGGIILYGVIYSWNFTRNRTKSTRWSYTRVSNLSKLTDQ